MKTTNTKSYLLTTQKKEFKANNLFAEYIDDSYCVFSYGWHFPIYVFKAGKWFENADKYSVSTSKHQTQARPTDDTIKVSTETMKDLIYSR
tara:strand:- start:104 stop:376 length:273 start_codon:yes stop_codon:yes gene_type:complete